MNIYLSEEIFEKVAILARSKGISFAEQVRRIIDSYLKGTENV